jgi:hypothetical protein
MKVQGKIVSRYTKRFDEGFYVLTNKGLGKIDHIYGLDNIDDMAIKLIKEDRIIFGVKPDECDSLFVLLDHPYNNIKLIPLYPLDWEFAYDNDLIDFEKSVYVEIIDLSSTPTTLNVFGKLINKSNKLIPFQKIEDFYNESGEDYQLWNEEINGEYPMIRHLNAFKLFLNSL